MNIVPIIKAVAFDCNLKCDYCFYHYIDQDLKQRHLMGDDALTSLIQEMCNQKSSVIEFIWHGGEPLLAGIDFFSKIINLQNKYRKEEQQIINKIQTNGTLINNEWVDFFFLHRFGVGVSLDGSQDLHNIFRKFPNGEGSFQSTWNGINLLREAGLNPGIIAVINSENVKDPKKLFDFFIVESKLKKIAFNHTKSINYGKGKSAYKSSVTSDAYGWFLKNIFDFWLEKNDPEIEIKQIKSIIQTLLGGSSKCCEFTNSCCKFLTINYDGAVHPCDCIDQSIPDYYFGNIREGVSAILESQAYKTFAQNVSDIKNGCIKCKWQKICKGGCTRDYFLGNSKHKYKNHFCKALKDIYQHIYRRLKVYNMPIIELT